MCELNLSIGLPSASDSALIGIYMCTFAELGLRHDPRSYDVSPPTVPAVTAMAAQSVSMEEYQEVWLTLPFEDKLFNPPGEYLSLVPNDGGLHGSGTPHPQ